MFYDLNDYFNTDGIIGKRDIAVALFNELTDIHFSFDVNIEVYILKRRSLLSNALQTVIIKKNNDKEKLRIEGKYVR